MVSLGDLQYQLIPGKPYRRVQKAIAQPITTHRTAGGATSLRGVLIEHNKDYDGVPD